MPEKTLLKHTDTPNSETMDFYLSQKGYEASRKALTSYEPAKLIDEVKGSGLRGRGGAGFSTGMKWSFVPKDIFPKYLVCNADESEPGTFKDRALIERYPHSVIEGIIIACWAVQINSAFIYIRGEFTLGAKKLQKAIDEAYQKGFLGKNIFGSKFNLDITVHRGAGAYICGEETGLLTSIEGYRGYPKIKPPFPAIQGLFAKPTVINNVETLANLPYILNNGAQWFKSMGTEKSPGPKIFCVSGHVNKPGLYELPLGTPCMEIINNYGGGVWKNRKLKAVIPGGSSAPVLTAAQAEKLNMDYEAVAAAGSMLGSGGLIVMDETVCMVNALYNLIRFYHHESCGQCTPCRYGTGWLDKILHRMEHGNGKQGDIELMLNICDNMRGKTICVLADAAAMPVQSFIKNFRDEFEYHIKEHKCTVTI
ncbi:MAG: NADH-quinone oxidoreductase subunit NuoF [Planctomycetes bacterium]|nr:NADH-quinone oxidoreductase subunit NuoF [Planctomycetota bacterium]